MHDGNKNWTFPPFFVCIVYITTVVFGAVIDIFTNQNILAVIGISQRNESTFEQ